MRATTIIRIKTRTTAAITERETRTRTTKQSRQRKQPGRQLIEFRQLEKIGQFQRAAVPAVHPGGKNQKDQDKDDDKNPNNQGPGGFNKVFGPNQPGFPGKSPTQQPVIVPGGAAEPVNKKLGSWKGNKWQGTRKVDNWTKVFGNSQQPFSSQWYKDHPQAWKYDNNKSNVWVVATVPGVYSWLGWGNVPPQYGVNFGNVDDSIHPATATGIRSACFR